MVRKRHGKGGGIACTKKGEGESAGRIAGFDGERKSRHGDEFGREGDRGEKGGSWEVVGDGENLGGYKIEFCGGRGGRSAIDGMCGNRATAIWGREMEREDSAEREGGHGGA